MKAHEVSGFLYDDGTPQDQREELCCFHDDCHRPWGESYLFIERDEDDWLPICYRCFFVHVVGVSEEEADEMVTAAEGWHREL